MGRKRTERDATVGRAGAQAVHDGPVLPGYEKILTFMRAENPGAPGFHLTLGFQLIGTARRRARINGNYVDEVMIEKFLSREP